MSLIPSFFKRAAPLNLDGCTDWHCHLLPGVDDGVGSVEETLEILKGYENAGISEVWLTPHIMEDIPNTTSDLKSRYAELESLYRGPVRLHLAAENMIDGLFQERLEADDLLPIGADGRMLLVETSYFRPPMNLVGTLDDIKAKGYYPLLAHPERYDYIDSMEQYRGLKSRGVMFQLNIMSLCGHYGPVVRAKARKILSEGLYDRIGSDLHRYQHLDIIKDMKLSHPVADMLKKV